MKRLVLALSFIVALSGCSSTTSPILVARSNAVGNRVEPQSLGKWTRKAPMPTVRDYLAAATLNGELYAVGGTNGGGQILTTVEAYDRHSNSWTTKAPMPTGRFRSEE